MRYARTTGLAVAPAVKSHPTQKSTELQSSGAERRVCLFACVWVCVRAFFGSFAFELGGIKHVPCVDDVRMLCVVDASSSSPPQRHLLPGQHRQRLNIHGATQPRRRGTVPTVEVPHVRRLEERVVSGLQPPHRGNTTLCVHAKLNPRDPPLHELSPTYVHALLQTALHRCRRSCRFESFRARLPRLLR